MIGRTEWGVEDALEVSGIVQRLPGAALERLTKAIGSLLRRAAKAGDIRSDIKPEDLLCALVGMCHMHDQPGWQRSVLHFVDIFVDGLRVR